MRAKDSSDAACLGQSVSCVASVVWARERHNTIRCASTVATSFKSATLWLYGKSLLVGHASGCHQLPERSFFIGTRKLPVCARCTGIFFGGIGTTLTFLIAAPLTPPSVLTATFLLVPLIVDGTTQLLTRYESTNLRRFITGVAFSIGIVSLLIHLFS